MTKKKHVPIEKMNSNSGYLDANFRRWFKIYLAAINAISARTSHSSGANNIFTTELSCITPRIVIAIIAKISCKINVPKIILPCSVVDSFLSSSHLATNNVLENMNSIPRYTDSNAVYPNRYETPKDIAKKITDWIKVVITISFPRYFSVLKSNSRPIRKSKNVMPSSDIKIIMSELKFAPVKNTAKKSPDKIYPIMIGCFSTLIIKENATIIISSSPKCWINVNTVCGASLILKTRQISI